MIELQLSSTLLYSKTINLLSLITLQLVVHGLQLRDGGQDGEVGDGEVVAGDIGLLGQEAVQVVQVGLQGVGAEAVPRFAFH